MELVNFYGIQLLNALWLSALLFMLAVGLSVVFGLLDVLNLAHCTLYMIGAYVGYTIAGMLGPAWPEILIGMLGGPTARGWLDPYWLALMLAPIAVTVIGAVLYLVLLKRLRGNHLIQALVTFGLLFVGYDAARMIWDVDQYKLADPVLLAGTIPIFDQTYPVYRLFVIGIGIATALALYIGLERTRLGAIVRAGVDDRETAAVLGINIDRAFFIVFCIGTALAGFAGVLAAPIRSVEPGIDVEILIPALIVVVIGGPGSLKGAVLGAFIIGTAETFGPVVVPEFASFIMYAVMAGVLLVRPEGLLPVKPAH